MRIYCFLTLKAHRHKNPIPRTAMSPPVTLLAAADNNFVSFVQLQIILKRE